MVWAALLVFVLAGGALLVARRLHQALDNPLVQRLETQRRLRQFAEALHQYQDRHQTWPDNLFQLMRDAKLPLGLNVAPGAGVLRYARPTASGAVVLVSEGWHRALRRGDILDDAGTKAAADSPAVRYLLGDDLVVFEQRR